VIISATRQKLRSRLIKLVSVYSSAVLVQRFIFILVFIQFSVNHVYLYSVLVLSTFIYSILVQAFTIIFVLIHFSFLINQIYEMYCYSTVSIQLKIILFSFAELTHLIKFSTDLALKIPALAVRFVRIIGNLPSTYLYVPTTLFSFAYEFSF